jgi:hypothetical protein
VKTAGECGDLETLEQSKSQLVLEKSINNFFRHRDKFTKTLSAQTPNQQQNNKV